MDDIAILDCPTCTDETEHAVLRATEHSVKGRCLECGTVHAASPRHAKVLELPLVISDEGQGRRTFLPVMQGDEVRKGDEFELEGQRLLVTGLEARDGTFPPKAAVESLQVLHAKAFDRVRLRLSLNDGPTTQSFERYMDPDAPVAIGEVIEVDDVRMVVKTLKSDQNRTVHKGFLAARNIHRAFCDPAPANAQAGEKVAVRRRGAPEKTTPRGARHRRQGPTRRRS
ncbi:MAG: HVO_0476 family zinc finger protein [Thermoplasmatota archaeon]